MGKHWPESEWVAAVERFEASGRTRGDFSRELGVAPGTLDGWRRRLHERRRLVPVELTGAEFAAPGLVLTLANGRRVEVGAGFDERVLERLLAVAERDA